MMDLMVTPAHYVMLASILFGLGAFGALTRRSGLMLLMFAPTIPPVDG